MASSSSDGEGEAEERRNWVELPREVTALIMSRVKAEDILRNAQLVCKAWLEVCKDPTVWRRVDMQNAGGRELHFELERMCRHAVDRSCGQLVDINIEYIANDDLLQYIADRSTQIKRLRVTSGAISCQGLVDAITRLPLLEELELTVWSYDIERLEAVGRSCPGLKSITLNCEAYRLTHLHTFEEAGFNAEAIAVGKTMPELRRLKLIGSFLTDLGLRAILDGCPLLESLDLGECLTVHFSRTLWARCAGQLDYVRLPHEPDMERPFKPDPRRSSDYVTSDEEYSPYDGVAYPSPYFNFMTEEEELFGDEVDEGGCLSSDENPGLHA